MLIQLISLWHPQLRFKFNTGVCVRLLLSNLFVKGKIVDMTFAVFFFCTVIIYHQRNWKNLLKKNHQIKVCQSAFLHYSSMCVVCLFN